MRYDYVIPYFNMIPLLVSTFNVHIIIFRVVIRLDDTKILHSYDLTIFNSTKYDFLGLSLEAHSYN